MVQTVGFRYYGDGMTEEKSVTASLSNGNFKTTLSGLTPGVEYIYYAYAVVAGTGDKTSTVKTFEGEFKSFTTTAPVISKQPSATVGKGSYTITAETTATLSATYSNATSTPTEVGFWWGTSSSEMTNKLIATDNNGTFTATLTGLTSGQNVVFQPYIKVAGTGTYASDIREFWASASTYFEMPGATKPAVDKDWLELPSGMDDNNGRYMVNTTYSGERNYTHLYDTQMMTSLWTAYPLNSSHMGSISRPSNWSYNPSIEQKYQPDVRSHSYSTDTYSRGHMCPNGSRNGNSTMQDQTFYVTNQVPQIQQDFNNGVWSNLEKAVQGVADKEEVYVVTGVAFNKPGENRTINYVTPKDDTKKCPIPNYFYKVVLRVKYSGNQVTAACIVGYWFEHRTYTDKFDNYAVSVDQIEQWTGFDFFVNLPDDIEEAAESQSTNWDKFYSWK